MCTEAEGRWGFRMGRWLLHILHSAERVGKNEVIFTSNKAVSGNLESDVEGAESVGGIGRACADQALQNQGREAER